MIRPESVDIEQTPSEGTNRTTACVTKRVFVGQKIEYEFSTPAGVPLSAITPSHLDIAIGEVVGLRLTPERCVLLGSEQAS